MGAGIVQVSIDKNIHTTMKDMAMPGLIRGQQQIEKGLKTAVKKRKMTQWVELMWQKFVLIKIVHNK